MSPRDIFRMGLRRAGASRQALDAAVEAAAPVILRLAFGRWPDAAERRAFRRAAATEYVGLPPLLRGLMVFPDLRDAVRCAAAIDDEARRRAGDAGSEGGGDAGSDGGSDADPFATRVFPGGVAGPDDLGGDIYAAWTGPALGFLHVEKCGGVALIRWLSRQFHPRQIDPDPARAAPPHQFVRAVSGIGTEVGRFPLTWGHYDLGAFERFAGERLVFTMLREPRARLVSLYHYWRSVRPEKLDDPAVDPLVGVAHRCDLLGFLQSEAPLLRDYIDNVYARRLTGRYATGEPADRLRTDRTGTLEAAEAALGRLAFVGITERLDETAQRLAAVIGAVPPTDRLRANVAVENPADPSGWFRPVERQAITPEIEAALDRLTDLDSVLYARALARFDASPAAPASEAGPAAAPASLAGADRGAAW